MNVVTPFDIYPEDQAHIQHPPTSMIENTPIVQQPNGIMSQPVSQPSIIIAPKFFNGNGSDHSTEATPTNGRTLTEDFINVPDQPSIVVKDSVKDSTSITKKPQNSDIDFSNIVITKAGQ